MKWVQKFSWLIYIIIPAALVCINVALELAQGEKTEEIAFGIEMGLAIDLIILLLRKLICKVKSWMNRKPDQ